MSAKNTKKSKESFAYGKQFNEDTASSDSGVVELQSTKEGAVFSVLPGSETSAILSGSTPLSSSATFATDIETESVKSDENLVEPSVEETPIEASVDEDFTSNPLDS
jgi:hypothetical protein